MRLLGFLHAMAAQSPVVPSVDDVDKLSSVISRGGLYTICSILLLGLVAMFVLKEWQLNRLQKSKDELQKLKDTEQKAFQDQLIKVVESLTASQTKQALLAERMESVAKSAEATLLRVATLWDTGKARG